MLCNFFTASTQQFGSFTGPAASATRLRALNDPDLRLRTQLLQQRAPALRHFAASAASWSLGVRARHFLYECMPWQLQALARALLRAPLHLQRNFSSSGSDDNASTSKARPGLRRSAKGNTSAPKEVHHAIDFRGGGGIGVLSASPRTVRRFAVCEDLPSDSPAGAAQQQSFWWSSDPAMYILGIDCSVRSTGYCVLKARAAPAGPLQQNQVPVISSAASSANAGANDGTAAHCVAACGSISTSTGMASSIDPARFLTEVRACLAQVKGDVEKEFGAGKWLVVVEDCLIQYQGRRSSADTIVNLARFNALISGAVPCLPNCFAAPGPLPAM